MEKIDSEKIFIIAAAIVVVAFLGTITLVSMNDNVIDKQKYDMCINKGGTWIGTSDKICIQRGTF